MQISTSSNWRHGLCSNGGVSIVPFHWGHAYMADLRPIDRQYIDLIPNYKHHLQVAAAAGIACTAMLRGKIACCFGVNELWPGVGEGWMLTTDHVNTAPVSLTRGAYRYFNLIATELVLHRLQLTVNMDNDLAIRWADALQFAPEGLLRNYGPDGADYRMYARYYN
jgi:hypothetical protein